MYNKDTSKLIINQPNSLYNSINIYYNMTSTANAQLSIQQKPVNYPLSINLALHSHYLTIRNPNILLIIAHWVGLIGLALREIFPLL